MVDAIINSNVRGQVNAMIQGIFGDGQQYDLDFTDQLAMVDSKHDSEESPNYNGNYDFLGSSIHLNKDVLSTSSQEYIAATIMHEALHAYMDYQGIDIGDEQHKAMAAKYINTMATDLKNMFPTLTNDAAYALAWGGLENTSTYKNPGDIYLPPHEKDYNTLFRAHTNPQTGAHYGHGCNN